MVRFFVAPEELERSYITLTGENAQHAKVLRLKAGEQVLLCDGEGCEALCVVEEMDGKSYLDIYTEKKNSEWDEKYKKEDTTNNNDVKK